MIRRTLLLAAAFLSLSAAADPATVVTPVDPLTVQDDDFARHRDPAEWKGLKVERIEFREERAQWRLWRITNTARPRGPLWFVPHDNENGGFEAALVAVKRYGGTIVAVDAGVHADHDGQRFNYAVDYGRPVDPNRNFDSALPGYARIILASHRPADFPIIALHTNQKGFNTAESNCNKSDPPGNGIISIRYCDDFYTPHPSTTKTFPFDDDDSVAFVTHLTGRDPAQAFCWALTRNDFNVVQERVVVTDRSASNYAALHGLHYLNFETLDSGLTPAALEDQRNRLTTMIDRAMALCAPAITPIAPK
ncbi:hypothetical protein P1X14_02565 [Sphingomonas sp. AOB5]|uniref:hypothetical protein n=1 Tax=Sphingomonas sp. AOB5 TaxID=3034017 RepID=UPI0023F72DAC|nr:hypothetical protein [Sphingomonas sp. AOB5]MDF7774118.1 hypothetical protein [Sphingomonas sp. AOB5]